MRALAVWGLAGTAVLGIAAVGAFALGSRSLAGSASASGLGAAPVERPGPDEIRSPAADGDSGAPSERLAAAIAPPQPPPPEPEGIEDGGPAPAPHGDFSVKYARSSAEELVRAAVALDERFLSRSDREFEARFADGRYVEHRLEPGERRDVDEIVAARVAPGRLHRVEIVLAPPGDALPDRERRVEALRIVEISPEELPELYALEAERDWLRRFLSPSRP